MNKNLPGIHPGIKIETKQGAVIKVIIDHIPQLGLTRACYPSHQEAAKSQDQTQPKGHGPSITTRPLGPRLTI